MGQFGPNATVEIYFDNVQMVASTSTATPPPAETSSVTETPTLTTESPTPTPTLPVTPLGQLTQAKYTYDGDGNLVKSEVTSLVNDVASQTITYYASSYYNVQNTDNGMDKIQMTYSFDSQNGGSAHHTGRPKLVVQVIGNF